MTDIVERLKYSLSVSYSELRKEAALEIMRLRAKIEQMEKQEPVAWTTKLALEYGASRLGFQVSGVNIWGENGVPLYALPAHRLSMTVARLGTMRGVAETRSVSPAQKENDDVATD